MGREASMEGMRIIAKKSLKRKASLSPFSAQQGMKIEVVQTYTY